MPKATPHKSTWHGFGACHDEVRRCSVHLSRHCRHAVFFPLPPRSNPLLVCNNTARAHHDGSQRSASLQGFTQGMLYGMARDLDAQMPGVRSCCGLRVNNTPGHVKFTSPGGFRELAPGLVWKHGSVFAPRLERKPGNASQSARYKRPQLRANRSIAVTIEPLDRDLCNFSPRDTARKCAWRRGHIFKHVGPQWVQKKKALTGRWSGTGHGHGVGNG